MSDLAKPHSSTLHTALNHLAVVCVEGPDAGTFLQGQLTQDVLSQTHSEARAGGYCSAKGRLLVNFLILHPKPDAWWFITHASLVDAWVKRLRMFVLRAKCTVQHRSDWAVFGVEPGTLPLWQVGRVDESQAGLQMGWWGGRGLVVRERTDDAAPSTASVASEALQAWLTADIQAGWPWIEAATQDQFVPQMVNLELLGGVNFRKGCYPGQEVVARSQYRGILKRRMLGYRAVVESGQLPPQAGQEVFHSADPGQPAGMVVNAAPVPRMSAAAENAAAVWVLLVEIKTAATHDGTLHLGTPEGLALGPFALPYPVPAEAQD